MNDYGTTHTDGHGFNKSSLHSSLVFSTGEILLEIFPYVLDLLHRMLNSMLIISCTSKL